MNSKPRTQMQIQIDGGSDKDGSNHRPKHNSNNDAKLLFSVPTDLFLMIFEYLTIYDVGRLDIAICCNTLRAQFLANLATRVVLLPLHQKLNIYCISWMRSRYLKAKTLNLHPTIKVYGIFLEIVSQFRTTSLGMSNCNRLIHEYNLDFGRNKLFKNRVEKQIIENFDLSNCDAIDREDIVDICRNFGSNMKSIIVSNCSRAMNDTVVPHHTHHKRRLGLRSQPPSSVDVITRYCPKLIEFNCQGCKLISNPLMIELSTKLLCLRKVNVSYCENISNDFIISLATYCRLLESIDVIQCVLVTDESLVVLAKNCRGLEAAYLGSMNGDITDRTVGELMIYCPNMKHLDVCAGAITSQVLIEFLEKYQSQLESFGITLFEGSSNVISRILPESKIRRLYISNCDVNDHDFLHIVSNCPNLNRLGIAQCYGLTSLAMSDAQLKNFEYLDMNYCVNITDLAVATFLRNCKLLKSFFSCGCSLRTMTFGLCASNLTQLTELEIDDISAVYNLKLIVRNCVNLEFINGRSPLYYCLERFNEYTLRGEFVEELREYWKDFCITLFKMGWSLRTWAGPSAREYNCAKYLWKMSRDREYMLDFRLLLLKLEGRYDDGQ